MKRALICLLIPIANLCPAQWVLVDDFESYEAKAYRFETTPHLFSSIGSFDLIPYVYIYSGIPGTGGGKAAAFGYQSLAGGGSMFYQLPLPEEIGSDETGTVTLRVWSQSYAMGYFVSLSRTAAGEETNISEVYGHQAAILRYRPESSLDLLSLQAFDGNAYTHSNPGFRPKSFTWYTYWIVAENSFDPVNPTVSTGGYEVYVQGPDDPVPVLLTWGTDPGHSWLGYRNREEATIKTLCLGQIDYGPYYTWLVDDIYYSPGRNLTDFRTSSWCGGDGLDGPVDTGPWLGWIHPVSAPAGPPFWAWSERLNQHLYIANCPDAGGAWVFIVTGHPE